MNTEPMSGKPVRIEIRKGGNVKTTQIFPSDPLARKKFFQAYRDILACDTEPAGFVEFLAGKIDSVFGDGIAGFILDGQCRADELIRFLCETAGFFKNARERLIDEYLGQNLNEVML